MQVPDLGPYDPQDFFRQDEADDGEFYKMPRMVVHIDEQAIETVRQLYNEVFSPIVARSAYQAAPASETDADESGLSVFLDLMSSWRSHWPFPKTPKQGKADTESPEIDSGQPEVRLVGLGLNEFEMRQNPELDACALHDINEDPVLPFDEESFDGVVNTVSVQYMTRPVELFRDVYRVLRPGCSFVVVFSNRMFPTKAVNAWTARNDLQRMDLVAAYFYDAGNYEDIKGTCRNPGRRPGEDPIYVVMARKPAR